MMRALLYTLAEVGAIIAGGLFVWFLYEITRLEGYPGRKWHHAYISLVLAVVAFVVVSNAWGRFLFVVVAILLIVDDAAQHRVHNRLKRAGVPPYEWPVSWLHRHYERLYRSVS